MQRLRWSFLFCFVFCQGFGLTVLRANEVFSEKKKQRDSPRNAMYLFSGPQLDIHKARDFGVSPLMYQGTSPGFFGGIQAHSDQTYGRFMVGYAYGYIEPNIDLGVLYRTQNHSLVYDMSYLKRVAYMEKLKTRLYLGGSVIGTYHARINPELNNAAFHYDFITGLGPGIRFERDFSWKKVVKKIWFINLKTRERHITTAFQMNLPIAFLYMRPEYAVIRDFTNGTTGFSGQNSLTFGSLGSVYRLNTSFDLQYFLRNGNALRFSYIWDAGSLNSGFNDLQTSHHLLQFSLMFKFNKTDIR
ncbi:MAG: hypothetical protein ACFCUU_08130 [Cyclobacteriaceae bacterium]